MLEAIRRVKGYVAGKSFQEFARDSLTVDAVLRNLEIIGEAASQLKQEFKAKYANIPWRDIQDFRIVVAHKYWKINLDRIWDIIGTKLNPLKKEIGEILQKELK